MLLEARSFLEQERKSAKCGVLYSVTILSSFTCSQYVATRKDKKNMEKLTQAEAEQLKKLQAKKKRIERAERDFWIEVEERREEVLARLGVNSSKASYPKFLDKARVESANGEASQSEVHLNAQSASSGTELLFDAVKGASINESDATERKSW